MLAWLDSISNFDRVISNIGEHPTIDHQLLLICMGIVKLTSCIVGEC